MIRGNLIKELTGLSLYSLGIDSFVIVPRARSVVDWLVSS